MAELSPYTQAEVMSENSSQLHYSNSPEKFSKFCSPYPPIRRKKNPACWSQFFIGQNVRLFLWQVSSVHE